MNHKFRIIFLCFTAIFFVACNSRQYYTPEITEGEIEPLRISSALKTANRNGITLESGQILTADGILEFPILPKQCSFLNQKDDLSIAVCEEGKKSTQANLVIFDTQQNELFSASYEHRPLAATLDKDLLALVLADNTLIIQNIKNRQTLFSQKESSVMTFTSITASPVFTRDLIVFPLLDGALMIVDKRNYKIVRKIPVGNDENFNNVSFLDLYNNRLIAATKSRMITVSPEFVNTYDVNLRQILVLSDRIYLFTAEGEVLLSDFDLNIKKRIKFPFAHFLGVNFGTDIYILEKRGYLIALNPDFVEFRTYKIPGGIDLPVFGAKKALYFGQSYIKIN
ncbi:hypothetical protein CCZ01_01750 [Helicobacter monodelphidis]|uniref:hypothetical protein n=1 Tax=Helicobacter sp. 15-1451 TaxID=2004995 RepID=UPI000DCDA18B|nr:hypothetical protein [Helicobacter sp. 15-1451]RAX58940.1 hypothetical protein CCZ01_01750 [Helicobacter sp. 15-1451]